jgi:hypothetical protein
MLQYFVSCYYMGQRKLAQAERRAGKKALAMLAHHY